MPQRRSSGGKFTSKDPTPGDTPVVLLAVTSVHRSGDDTIVEASLDQTIGDILSIAGVDGDCYLNNVGAHLDKLSTVGSLGLQDGARLVVR